MKRTLITVSIWLSILTLWPVAAEAQRGARREALREKVKSVRIARVIEALALDPPTAARLTPVLDKGYDAIAEVARDTGAARRELKNLVTAERPDEARLNGLIDRLVAAKSRVDAIQLDMFRDARRVLTPRQAARLMLVLPEIDREIRQRIRQAAKGGGPAGADDPDDPF